MAREFADFPVTLEAARECLQDVFDVPGLVGLMREVAGRKVRLVEVETARPSPFARSLLFGYVGAFLYGDDAPLAERRAAALALDSTLLGELLGRVELRELLDPEVVAETERRLQWLDGEPDPARRRGPGRAAAPARRPVQRRVRGPRRAARSGWPSWRRPGGWSRSASPARSAGSWPRTPAASATRSAWRCRSAWPAAYLEPVADPLGDLVARYARTHGPFTVGPLRGPVRARRRSWSSRRSSGSRRPGG